MMKLLQQFIIRNSDRFLSRWVVFIFDLVVILIAYLLAVFLRYNLQFQDIPEALVFNKIAMVAGTYALAFILSRSHVGIIRHTGMLDALAIFRANLIGIIILLSFSFVSSFSPSYKTYFYIPNSIIVIHFLLNLFTMVGSRLGVKMLYLNFKNSRESKKTQVLIYGAGASGIITKNTLLHDTSREYGVVGYVDDNPYKIGKSIEGIPVYGRERAFTQKFLEKNRVKQVIISIQSSLGSDKKREIIDQCLKYDLEVKMVPPADQWIAGELSTRQIKKVRIEDLLEREPIQLDSCNVKRELKGKVVLVTGAAGSIGGEIARQVLHYNPAKLVLLDQAESPLHEVDYELKTKNPELYNLTECVLANVNDAYRMNKVFDYFRPHFVFHAAAYKHVPLMESNPYEAVGVNILGTKKVADLSAKYEVKKMVMVSTDKAVNPTNVMGASKRTAEVYAQSLGNREGCKTQFITTRFGNVLGSNGSVIPLFRKQIESGGPITITHRDITRYFMTIPEACNLVLEAGAMGNGGEIFVFDMGKSVKIYDLARKMIKLSGLNPDEDIEIKEVGLRPGEKLYEELLALKENTISTHHPKIMIARTETYNYAKIYKAVAQIETDYQGCGNVELVSQLKQLIPEFISNNSEYASLDLKHEPDE